MNENEQHELYWDYLTGVIIESIAEVNDYGDIDFMMIKLNLLKNLELILSSEEEFKKSIDILKEQKMINLYGEHYEKRKNKI